MASLSSALKETDKASFYSRKKRWLPQGTGGLAWLEDAGAQEKERPRNAVKNISLAGLRS